MQGSCGLLADPGGRHQPSVYFYTLRRLRHFQAGFEAWGGPSPLAADPVDVELSAELAPRGRGRPPKQVAPSIVELEA